MSLSVHPVIFLTSLKNFDTSDKSLRVLINPLSRYLEIFDFVLSQESQ